MPAAADLSSTRPSSPHGGRSGQDRRRLRLLFHERPFRVHERRERGADQQQPHRPDERQAPAAWDRDRVEKESTDVEVFPGISMDPDIRFGKPCVAGTRIDVATIVGAIAAGETVETVANEYALTVEQARSALSYAAHLAAHLPPAVRRAS